MRFVTTLGEATLPMLAAAVLLWSFDRCAGERLLMFDAGGPLVNQLLKISFCVYRPWIRSALVTPEPEAMTTATGYSFPSGHVTNSGAWLGGVGVYLCEKWSKGARRTVAIGALAVIWALVGFFAAYPFGHRYCTFRMDGGALISALGSLWAIFASSAVMTLFIMMIWPVTVGLVQRVAGKEVKKYHICDMKNEHQNSRRVLNYSGCFV